MLCDICGKFLYYVKHCNPQQEHSPSHMYLDHRVRTFSLTCLLYTCAYFQFWFLRSCIINSPIWCRNTTIAWQTPPPKRWKIGTTLTGKQQELPHVVTPTHIHTPPHLYLSYPSPLTKRLSPIYRAVWDWSYMNTYIDQCYSNFAIG